MRGQLVISTAALLLAIALPVVGWCEPGYSWVYRPHVTTFLDFAVLFIIIPWIVLNALLRLARIAVNVGSRLKGSAERRRRGEHRLQAG